MAKGGKISKKGAKKGGKKGEVSKRSKLIKGNKTRRTFNSAIKRVAKKPISGKGVKVMNSFVQDMLDRIASAAANVARTAGKATLNAAAAQAAVRMVLPADLAKHSGSEASKAVAAFSKTIVKKSSGKKTTKK